MSAVTGIASAAVLIQLAEPLRQKKLFQGYPEVVTYALRKVANSQAIVETKSAILCYAQLVSMSSMQYVADLYAKSSQVSDVYDIFTVNEIFIERVNFSFRDGLRV